VCGWRFIPLGTKKTYRGKIARQGGGFFWGGAGSPGVRRIKTNGRLGEAPLPRAAQTPDCQPRGADVYDAIGAAAGFDPGVAEVFAGEKQAEVLGQRIIRSEIGDNHRPECELVFVVLELPVDVPDARGELVLFGWAR